MLITGLFTRAAAVVTIGLSVSLMLMFGWQGATCIDEWTMAAANLGMGATLLLGGSGAYSLDNVLLRSNPWLAGKTWFRWISGSLPLPLQAKSYRNLALALFAFTVIFNVGTYSYYRGSVYSAFHGGPVSPTQHGYALSNGVLSADGSVRFHAYLDSGTPEEPAHIVAATLLQNGKPVEQWNTAALTKLPKTSFQNDFAYQKFKAGPYGIVSGMGRAAARHHASRDGNDRCQYACRVAMAIACSLHPKTAGFSICGSRRSNLPPRPSQWQHKINRS